MTCDYTSEDIDVDVLRKDFELLMQAGLLEGLPDGRLCPRRYGLTDEWREKLTEICKSQTPT